VAVIDAPGPIEGAPGGGYGLNAQLLADRAALDRLSFVKQVEARPVDVAALDFIRVEVAEDVGNRKIVAEYLMRLVA